MIDKNYVDNNQSPCYNSSISKEALSKWKRDDEKKCYSGFRKWNSQGTWEGKATPLSLPS